MHDPDVLQDVDDILVAGRRARDLVHRLHLSTRGSEDETLHSVNVKEIVEEAVDITRTKWKDEPEMRNITIEVLTDLGNTPGGMSMVCGWATTPRCVCVPLTPD